MFVAFIDVLGFASAVSALSPEDESALTDILARGQDGSDEQELLPGHPAAASLYYAYTAFQRLVRDQIRWLTTSMPNKRETPQNLRTALFSDSVYIASDDVMILSSVIRIMMGALTQNIPIRAGIAEGGFISFEWSTRVSRLTDIHFGTPFLGSGVVRAYFAEAKGARGLRAIVHPSAAGDILNLLPTAILPLSEDEANEHGSHELVFDAGAWWPDVAVQWVPLGAPLLPDFLSRVEDLKRDAPPHTHVAYDATLRAIQRMMHHRERLRAEKGLIPRSTRSGTRARR